MGHSYHRNLTSRDNHYDGRHIHSSCKLFIINSIILSSYNRSWYSNEMIEDVLVNTRDNKRTVILINMFKITICNNMRILLCVCTIHTCLIVQTAVMSHREVHLDID